MKNIIENAGYKAALVQLNELMTAHAAASAEQALLLAQLSKQNPDDKPSALDRARAMLMGGAPAPRQDHNGLNLQLSACNERLLLLGDAIEEQREVMAGLVSVQSAVINAEAKQGHIKAAERIKTALAGLREAMQAEQSLRADIVAGGYRCSLEPLERPELNYADSTATISQYLRDVSDYVALNELAAVKTLNVRLLFGTGDNLPGDVLTMTGIEAAALVRVGHAEQTRDKPSRVARPVITSYGQTMATALS